MRPADCQSDTVVRSGRITDNSLRLLLLVQVITLFVAIPLGALHTAGFLLADLCRILFAAICIRVFTRHRLMRALLAVLLALMIVLPLLIARFDGGWDSLLQTKFITWTVALFNLTVTVLVARYVFGPGRVNTSRVLGAVLIYLNVAALFANAYSLLLLLIPGAISGLSASTQPGRQVAESLYFSLGTITSTGFGEILPVHPLARSLAGLEAVVGQLFPATLVARLIGLHLVHRQNAEPRDGGSV